MYRVEWSEGAIAQMTNAWLEADSALRATITAAANQIDANLLGDPSSRGESRSNDRRILLVALLGIVFRIEPQRQTVVVLRAWVFRRGRGSEEGNE